MAAILTHVAQSNLAAHKVDGRTTAVTAATVTVAVTSTPTSLADTYGFGETIVITVTASEAVEVEGDPEFEFSLTDMGGAANDPPATYDRTRSSPTTIVFTYTVQAGDRDNNGIWIGDHSRTFMLDANDRIRTASQQIDIDRSHPEKGTLAGHKVNGSLGAPTVPPDPTPPTLVLATATTLTIEWTHPGDGGSPLTRNFIEYRVEGTTDWTNWYRGETPTPVTRAVIRNLAAATAYDVRVHSTNAIGNSQWTQSATAFSTLAGTAATGAPTITGTAAVGQPLAVDLTGIADADGLTNASYSYQWVRVDADGLSNPADITDATDATYTLVDADLGTTLKVRVTFDDDGGSTETLTSAATATVTPAAGAPASPTNLSATVGVGQVVLVWQHSRGGVGGTRSSYEYRFSAGDMISPDAMWQLVEPAGGGPQEYYQVVKGLTSDTTHTIQVRAANPQGGSAPATVTATPVSQPSCTIDALGDRRRLWQGQLTAGVREIFTDGNVHTGYGTGGVETGTLTPDAFTFRSTSYSVYPRTYDDFLNVVLREQNINAWYPRDEVVDALRWHVCNTPYDFSSATPADAISEFSGYRWNVGSNWPPGIERTLRLSLPPNHAATGDPVISGTVQVGAELTALTDGIMDDDVLDDVFTYQWVRVDADGTSNEEDITDETDATYTLTADDRGKKVKVEVRFVDILGGEETRTSAATATLAGVPNTAATGAPTITGTAQVGQTLTASTTGIADANGLTTPTYTYQWIRVDGTDEADIAAANSSTYILVDADLGKTLKVKVTFDDDLGHTETLTSAATATVGAVATGPPTVTDVAVTSTPASGTTYYLAGEVIEFTVTFSAPVTVTATPKFAFRLGAATQQAAYASGSDSVALVFARTVQAGEVDRNGISWNAIALALDGGTITQTGATTAARLTHAEQAPLEGHRVDAAPPMQVSASVQGMSLVLVYDEPLDPASMPATGAYTVTATVGATTTNPAVTEVSIYGIWVTLTLDAAPAAGATVTLAYAPPASNPVQDEAGNDAPAFSGQSVRLGPPPPPPPDLAQVLGVGVAPGNAQLVVTWTAVDTATGYTVQWTSGGEGYNTGDRQAPVTSGSTTRYTIPSLINGTEYTVRVIATRTGVTDGPPSEEMTGTPRVPPPPPPPDLAQVLGVGVAPGNAQLVVTWTAVDTATGYTVQWTSGGEGYNTGDRQTPVTSGSTTRYTIPSLINGTEYTVRVIATRTGVTDGPPSAEMTGTPRVPPPPPPPVTDLAQVMGVGVASGNAQLVVTWTAVDTATGYTVQWTSGSQGYNTGDRQATVTSGSTTRYTIPSLINGTAYTVRVIATRTGVTDGPPSAEVTGTPVTTPAAPQDLRSEPGDAEVTLRWAAPASDGGSPILRYEYAVDDSGTWIDAGGDLEETVPGLTNGQSYAVAVRAVNAAGAGPAAEVTGTPGAPPAAPQDLRSEPGDAEVTLRWAAPASDGGSPILRYEYAIDDSGTWIDAGGDLEETVPGLTNGQSYAVAVRAVNAAGAGPATTVTASPVTTPAAPQDLRSEPGDAEVTLRWAAPASDGGSPILRYEYAIDDSGTWIDAGGDLEETVRDLTNGQRYTVAVRAVNAAGAGPAATVTATPVTTPGAPQDLRSEPGDAEVTLRWAAPASDGGSPILRYEYAIDDSGTWIDAGGDLEETVRDLANGQPYTFAVRAVNAAGDGPATTVTATPVTTPGAPQNLSWAPGDGQVTLSWDAPSSDGGAAITGYEYAIDDNGTWIDAGTDRRVTVSGLTNGQPYTFAVRAVNAVGGGDAATVTIVSADPLPQAWLARFGRAAADHVVEAVSDRWRGGPPASHVTIGGRQAGDLFGWTGLGGQAERDTAADRGDLVRTDASSTRRFAPFGNAGTGVGGTGPGMTVSANDMNRAPVGLGGVDRETGATLGGHAAQGALLGAFGLPDPRALTDLGALLMGSSFSYSGAREEDGRARTPGWLGEWSAWGRAATSRFSGADGELSLDGEVATAMLGFDSRWRRWLAGVVVSHSGGQGAYTHPTATSGAVASSLTALHPYVHFALNERTNFWSVLGYGVGRLSLKPERSATALKTDLTNTMAAFGGRMSVRSARAGRFELAILSDARLTNTASDAAAGLAGAVGRTSRVRMMLEGSGSMPLAAGGMLKPTLEAGLRYDAGDAETGAGLEVGGGLGYAAGRLSVEVGARGLLAHQDTEYEEWGFSGSIAYTPSADGRGLSTRIGSAWGATQSGVQSLWSRQDASGLVRNTAFDGAQRYQAELRYGLDGLQGRARWAPYIGVESGGRSSQALRQGVTLTLGRHFDAELELGRRRVGPVADPEHAVQLRGTLRW